MFGSTQLKKMNIKHLNETARESRVQYWKESYPDATQHSVKGKVSNLVH